ncbi:TMEM165/GDT1 family protein [Legionella maioricensis]|uniref:GDT1 family protein n=1 Tax=Legionella maioricensis TaxID=2896528 RepID=A0A9X2ICZ3_9GAMM|nr:TMEM165/GDT1 family protein [Legionella maioricensis]MCL9685701.1 TMEM165/GDT1 family protein [Legionella maioricensis]MCL9689142.1 TMEM165/GDT1 family protein [Legionella maioricensis]
MEALFVSIGVVALAEMGDKTQLLAFILAARFKQPLPIILGIFVATFINHGLAGVIGAWIITIIPQETLRWIIAGLFIGIGIWTLIPDKMEASETKEKIRLGVFGTTFVTFFLAEIGDKTQIATITLTAHYATPLIVIVGTTLGMLLADVPAVLIGNKFAEKIPMKLVNSITAGIFVLMGFLALFLK